MTTADVTLDLNYGTHDATINVTHSMLQTLFACRNVQRPRMPISGLTVAGTTPHLAVPQCNGTAQKALNNTVAPSLPKPRPTCSPATQLHPFLECKAHGTPCCTLAQHTAAWEHVGHTHSSGCPNMPATAAHLAAAAGAAGRTLLPLLLLQRMPGAASSGSHLLS